MCPPQASGTAAFATNWPCRSKVYLKLSQALSPNPDGHWRPSGTANLTSPTVPPALGRDIICRRTENPDHTRIYLKGLEAFARPLERHAVGQGCLASLRCTQMCGIGMWRDCRVEPRGPSGRVRSTHNRNIATDCNGLRRAHKNHLGHQYPAQCGHLALEILQLGLVRAWGQLAISSTKHFGPSAVTLKAP